MGDTFLSLISQLFKSIDHLPEIFGPDCRNRQLEHSALFVPVHPNADLDFSAGLRQLIVEYDIGMLIF